MAHDRRTFLKATAGACVGAVLTQPLDAARSAARPDDLTGLSLWGASELLRTRKVSPVELTDACLARIGRLNPVLNAFITVTADQARADAKMYENEILKGQWRGRLHGVPIGLKDLFDTAGVRTTAASAFFADRIPKEDAEVVRRLKAAGAILIGKQNMHEFAFGATSVPSHFGAVHNPWQRDFVAGGSSGGSAAALAAGLGYGALGSDTGGSIRQPAALCGIVGLKPTYGRVSTRGVIPLARSLDHVGPITRTVLDAAVLLQAIAGYDADDATSIDTPVPDYVGAAQRGASSIRVGVAREYFFSALDPEIDAAVTQALSVVAKISAGVHDVVVPVNPEMQATVLLAEAYAFHAARIAEAPGKFQPAVLRRLQQGQPVTAAGYIQQRRELDVMRRAARRLFAQADVLVTPTVPMLSVPIVNTHDDEESVALFARNTRPFNAYGLPAVSVPCGFAKNDLPIGLQIVGPPWGEETVLRLAHAYEQATAWHSRHPVL
jgi:aspartyl-tRNA(Asn)/glutamyl-tRNA(Gln) amidotransferase subunit A